MKEYSIDFIHLKQKCNEKNVLVAFTSRQAPHKELEWIKGLDAEDLEYIVIKIKRNWKDLNYIFEKKIESKNLK